MKITENCTGCMACYSSCPFGAINIKQNDEGFYVPKIDVNKCKKCNLCYATCPQNKEENFSNPVPRSCYAMQNTKEECQKSSSGAIFPLIAKYIIQQGGFVCGAVFDNNFKTIKHIIVDNIYDLTKLYTSKYVQSFIGNSFKEIKTLLENNKLVLFSGTPCQVMGLKSFLKKDYNNLYTIDILCHGTPSPLVWEKYLEAVSNNKKIKTVNFRDKTNNRQSTLYIEFDDNTHTKEDVSENPYYKAFLNNICLNKSCHFCKYTDTKRVGDISLGDFWGIKEVDSDFKNANQGVSLVFINNLKGEKIFQKINPKIKKEYEIKEAMKENPILSAPSIKHPNREVFFKNINKKPILKNINKALINKYDGIIINFWYTEGNYGAVLAAYATQQFLLSQGYDFNLLNFSKRKLPKFSSDFIQKYLKLTHIVYNFKELNELNNCTNNFVVGTDQVFRYNYISGDLFPIHTLSFAQFDKRKIAFSASFGKEKFSEASIFDKHIFNKCMKRFNAISVREKSGIKIFKKDFKQNVESILEPVFLIDKSLWDNLADSVNTNTENKIVSYILDENKETVKIYEFLKNKYNIEIEKLAHKNLSPQYFLSAIKNAKYIITDSFHGACFSLIFNKKLICMVNKNRGEARFNNLKEMFNISHIFCENYKDLLNKEEELFKSYNRKDFEEIIIKERKKAKDWLHKAFETKKNPTFYTSINENYLKLLFFFRQKEHCKFLTNKIEKYKLLFKLSKAIKSKKRVVLWGASLFLQEFLSKHKYKNIIGIIDSNIKLQGKIFQGYKVYPPKKLNELNPDVIICSIKNNPISAYSQIKTFLKNNQLKFKLYENIFE